MVMPARPACGGRWELVAGRVAIAARLGIDHARRARRMKATARQHRSGDDHVDHVLLHDPSSLAVAIKIVNENWLRPRSEANRIWQPSLVSTGSPSLELLFTSGMAVTSF